MNSLFILGVTCLSVCFSGVSSQCDLVEASKCLTGFTMPKMDSTTDMQTACKSFRQVTSCIEPYKSACAGDSSFQQMMGGINMAAGYCGGDSSCNPKKCYTDAGINITSSGSESPNVNCEVYVTVKTCFDSQSSACEGNSIYSMAKDSLQKVEKLCGSPGCNIDECNVDFSFPNGIPSKSKYDQGCSALKSAIPCLESKSKCPNLKALGSLTKGYSSFCEDASLKKGLETHKMCLGNATVNDKCKKHMTPSMSGSSMEEETEKEECQRIEDYAMCARKAVSVCDNEEVKNFAAETARKILFLKASREGGIDCGTGGGSSAIPAFWVLLSAAVMALITIYP